MSTAISISGLGKRYLIGATRERAGTLRDAITNAATAPVRRLRHAGSSTGHVSELWALRDVSFDVDAGQVIGVIGRNGAGKSTLLKILSRITKPTTGRVALHGRVGSLLEVGTGFHPELSGRENIYLNGAILGMTRAEIGRKFDDIVAFSEIAEFLDTPVKRYSTGMFVRLAFAVAAHLEPEILLVDEVLSVGDLAFQRKCLGQMEQTRRLGTDGRLRQPQHGRRPEPVHPRRRDSKGPSGRRWPVRRDRERRTSRTRRRRAGAVLHLPRPLGKPDELLITATRVVDEEGNDRGPVPQQPPRSSSRSMSTSRVRTRPTRSASICCRPTATFCGVGTRTGRTTTGRRFATGRNTLRCVLPAGPAQRGQIRASRHGLTCTGATGSSTETTPSGSRW